MTIKHHKYTLDNGLTLLVHSDTTTPLVAVNLLYNVGSKDENPSMTGFAHLFEHLMFGGTRAVPDFDNALQLAGGESNAFTNSDITNFYITIPSINLETALWLESDRMSGPDLSDKSLNVQKNVVSEEFRQRYLNQPYGDAMLNLRPLVYKVHPYRWPTIGMDISHIEKADHDQVRSFFSDHYTPENAILTIAGNIRPARALKLVTKWFDSIEPRESVTRNLPTEPVKTAPSRLVLEKDVPADAIFKAWVICPRNDKRFHIYDTITDILAGGESGRLYASLVRDKRVFSEINAYVTGEVEEGMLLITGRAVPGISMSQAEEALDAEINKIRSQHVPEKELAKVRNRFTSAFHISHTGIMTKATALSLFELMGSASDINKEVESYASVTPEMIMEAGESVLSENRASTLWYKRSE
ncbi:MAG: insulinase family protein [Bacteroidales bacterium]|nr:insulinase family protein [Bacteroidales bacterium]